MKRIISVFPGVFICLIIAVPAWFLGKAAPVIGGPVIAIVAGIAVSTAFPRLIASRFHLKEGIKFTSKKVLQASIVLLGFEMNLYHIIKVGGQSLFVMLFTLTAAFFTAFVMGKILKLSGNTTILIGVGTSICGGSAIAAAAPVIHAEDEEVAHAISTIFLFNIIAVFVFPLLGNLMGMSDMGFGMWAGTAINDTSSVVAAGTAWSNSVGNDTALHFATIVKLTRTLMIVPVTLVLAVLAAGKKKQPDIGGFRIVKVFPWFVILFIIAAVLNTFIALPAFVPTGLVAAGKFMIMMAMAAIGLGTSIKTLVSNGIKPILLGLCCWAAVAAISLIVQKFMEIL